MTAVLDRPITGDVIPTLTPFEETETEVAKITDLILAEMAQEQQTFAKQFFTGAPAPSFFGFKLDAPVMVQVNGGPSFFSAHGMTHVSHAALREAIAFNDLTDPEHKNRYAILQHLDITALYAMLTVDYISTSAVVHARPRTGLTEQHFRGYCPLGIALKIMGRSGGTSPSPDTIADSLGESPLGHGPHSILFKAAIFTRDWDGGKITVGEFRSAVETEIARRAA